MTFWSELPRARMGEMLADAATLTWVVVWGTLAWKVYAFLADLAGAGRVVRDSGTNLGVAGHQIADAIRGIPFIGEGAADAIGVAFASAAGPLMSFGTDLERIVVAIAALLALLLAAAALTPWLTRYLPWRAGKLRRRRAGTRVIRGVAVETATDQIQQLLASRALHRLEYDELLDYSPDPFGDWVSGRYDRLARAELASVGLCP